jgi:hypothetical protein
LRLTHRTETALWHIFEVWDATGVPDGLAGVAVPHAVFVVALAGDLEIFSSVHGLLRALALIAGHAGAR